MLPEDAATRFSEYLSGKAAIMRTKPETAPLNTFESSHVVKAGDRIEHLASIFHCSVQDIMRWNNLSFPEVYVHQELKVFLPKSMQSSRA